MNRKSVSKKKENISRDSLDTLATLLKVIRENLSEDEIELDYGIPYGSFYSTLQEVKELVELENAGEECNRVYLDESDYAYVHTKNGRFIIDPDHDGSYDGVYVSFQPYTRDDNIIPAEQQLVYIENITGKSDRTPKIRVAVWEDGENEDYTYNNKSIYINKAVMKSAEKE